MKKINQKIFKEYDIRGKYPEELDEGAAYLLGAAFIKSCRIKKIAAGHDCRPESAKVFSAFVRGAASADAQIFDLGEVSTPELFFAVGRRHFDGGVMATASHNPEGYAGFKLSDSQGVSLGLRTGLNKVIKMAGAMGYCQIKSGFQTRPFEIKDDYREFVFKLAGFNSRSLVRKSKKITVIFDAADGSGARLIEEVFSELPLKAVKMNFSPGDRYPDHSLNPMLAASRRPAKKVLKEEQADLAIVWDGDGDRCIFLDEAGNFIHPFYINCLLAEIILDKIFSLKLKKKPEILIDARLPRGISELIVRAGGRPIIHRAGYANIINTMSRRRLLFGCENSGHYMFNFRLAGEKKNFIFGDAVIPVLLVLGRLLKNQLSLSQAIAPFTEGNFISGELNFSGIDFSRLKKALKKKYRFRRKKRIDGLSIESKNWFFNIRPSHTEPIVRANIWANNPETLKKVKRELVAEIRRVKD